MHRAMIRGRVFSNPQFVTNDKKTRCHFDIGVELSRKRIIKEGVVETEDINTSVFVIASETLTERCRALLDKGDDILLFGPFGFHKGKLKMVAENIDLPDVQILA